eukprot:m.141789 g.141789  ORF g.141789 m.141789 type:complete len:116 (+) comp38348_c1_seq63:2754-3101(+)
MSTDIASVRLSTKPIHFTRSQSGWFFKADRTDKIGQYSGDVYDVHGLSVITRKRHANVFSHFYSNWTSDRREHLTDEDIQQNKAFLETFTKGKSSCSFHHAVSNSRKSSQSDTIV